MGLKNYTMFFNEPGEDEGEVEEVVVHVVEDKKKMRRERGFVQAKVRGRRIASESC